MTKIAIRPTFSAIIFDMDGLVLDTESTYLYAWQYAIQKMGYQADRSFCLSLLSLESATIKKRLFDYYGSNFNLAQFQQLSADAWYAYVQQYGIEKKQGLNALLTVIKDHNIPYCLASNSSEINVRDCLAFAGLKKSFKLIISRNHVKQGKPAPDIFLKAADLLQQPITHCLILEDSIIGIKAAQRAGAKAWLIPSQQIFRNSPLIDCDAIFDNLAEVAKIILADLPKN